MTSSDLSKRLNDSGYLNWLAVGRAIKILSEGLREYAKKEMQTFHSLMLCNLTVSGGVAQCSCVMTPGKKPNHVCCWARELKKMHWIKKKRHIPWHQSNGSKWHDPTNGYWEIAKLFMSDLGSDWTKVKDPSSTDPTGLLNLMYFCKHFKVQQNLVRSVRGSRNKWAHDPTQSLTDIDKQTIFKEIFDLMDDPELMTCKNVQDCRVIIEEVRDINVSILQESEVSILKELWYSNKCELSHEKKKNKEKERVLKTLEGRIGRIERLQGSSAGTDYADPRTSSFSFIHNIAVFFRSLFVLVYSSILTPVSGIARHFWWFLFMLALLGCLQIGDKSVVFQDIGCYRATMKSPISQYGFQEFNFSFYLNYKKSNFFGRQWFFQELENIFENGGPLGVLIVGDPGSGKSALMAQLICSRRYSSFLIHDNIIGYHLCDYSEKGKRDGARFVRNLVDQITGSIPEYFAHVASDKQVRNELDKRCESDPVGCFHSTVVGPLRDLKNPPDGVRYIFIDGLDECIEKDRESSEILDILSDKLVHFPDWLKVVITSRNWTAVTEKLPRTLERIPLDPADERNIEDILLYIRNFLSQNSFFMDRLLEAMGLTSTAEGINSLVNELSKKGEGNFLFVKTTLEYLNKSQGRIDLDSFPTSLYDTYDIFFRRQFGKHNFIRFKVLFEVLLAANSPLKLNEITSILRFKNLSYSLSVCSELLRQVSPFLRYGQDGTISIYHQSFAEWLLSHTDDSSFISLNKSIGHQYIADYLLDIIERRNTTPVLSELTELAVHVSSGGMSEKHLMKMKRMNISKIQSSCSGRNILHNLAEIDGTALILDLFLKMFKSADLPDRRGMTPAFYAALRGNIENMKSFVKKGVNLDFLIQGCCPVSSDDPVEHIIRYIMFAIEGYRIAHFAAGEGRTKMVKFLIENGVSFKNPNHAGITPFHLAVINGNLGMVKLLYRHGSEADVIALHHAAAKNKTKIVRFLLEVAGVKDECFSCKKDNISVINPNTTIQDMHVLFCETALHAAVSRRHLDIVKLLLSFSKASLECKHYSGKTPLMDAVERNDTEMVELLLKEGADVEAECEGYGRGELKELVCAVPFLNEPSDNFYTLYCGMEVCSCKNRPIHLCGRLGLWEMAEKLLVDWRANIFARNCLQMIAARFAALYDHVDFIKHFNSTLRRLTTHTLRSEAFLELATLSGSYNTLKLLSVNSKTTEFAKEDENGMTLLHHAAGWSPRPTSNEKLKDECTKRLSTVKVVVESQEKISWYINLKDKYGRSAVHHAALAGFAGAVKYLVRHGGDWTVKDSEGNTPLILALAGSPQGPHFVQRYHLERETKFKTCNTTTYDETVAYLIWLQRSTIKKCDLESMRILNIAIRKQLALTLYKLFKFGIEVNCRVGDSLRPFLQHLKVGGEQVSEVFKIFEINVTVECGVDFDQSELHLASFFSVSNDLGNFFKPSINNQTSPFQRIIPRHSNGLKIFSQCYDKEGYLAIHRAAQGGNLDAVDWFISVGASTSKRTRSGLTALDISIFNLGRNSNRTFLFPYDLNDISIRPNVFLEKHTYRIFQKLMLESKKHRSYCNWCNSKFGRLSPLHFAASRGIGMFEFVYKEAVKIIPSLPRNCSNKHGISPLYLAQIYLPENSLSPNDLSLRTQYPDREAEYHIIYNRFYESPRLHSSFGSDILDAIHCSGFHDLLPKRQTLLDKINECQSACWLYTLYVYNHSTKALPFKRFPDWRMSHDDGDWRPEIFLMSKLLHYSERENFSARLRREITKAMMCSRECRCTHIMLVLQNIFTIQFKEHWMVNTFTARRMGWSDTSLDGDVRDRWPFHFLFKKALNKYKSYQYLETLNSGLEIDNTYYYRYDYDRTGNDDIYEDDERDEDENEDEETDADIS